MGLTLWDEDRQIDSPEAKWTIPEGGEVECALRIGELRIVESGRFRFDLLVNGETTFTITAAAVRES